ncbi:MAG: tetrahydromethanopterin S-methyltransferase subunit A [Candidatus Bathyarchaeia archaeon]
MNHRTELLLAIKDLSKREIVKVKVPSEYPPEEGSYLRGNDFSPVAVCVLLHTFYDKIPQYLQQLVKISVESGAALAGYLQTENVGIEKIICNIVANPNIRYLIVCGVESPGHQPGQTLSALIQNGVDKRRRIIGAEAPTPYLYNIPLEAIERFRKQIVLINLALEEDRMLALKPEVIKNAIWACYQEEPTKFLHYTVYDVGAYSESPMLFKITWRVERPWMVLSEKEAEILKRTNEAIEWRRREEERRKEDERLLSLLRPKKGSEEAK